MNNIRKWFFPILLVATCCVVHWWQHYVAGLPYLPKNGILPLAILTPVMLVLYWLTTYAMLKETSTDRAGVRSLISLAVVFVPIAVAAACFLSYCARRYAGILPVLVLPDLPNGIIMIIVTLLLLLHLTALLIYRFAKQRPTTATIVISSVGWVLFNCCMFLITV